MRYLILIVVVLFACVSCNKDKYTTAPQIKFKSITDSLVTGGISGAGTAPILRIQVTDAEGDLGFSDDEDTSYIYIKNLSVPPNPIDSFKFPYALPKMKKFKGDVYIDLSTSSGGLGGILGPGCGSHCRDTIYFEVYVKDFAKNKSNVIKTDKPFIYIHP